MIQLCGWVATVLFTVCAVPQMVKMLRRKSVDDVSFLFLFISFSANIVALIYAIGIKQNPLIIKYILGIVFMGACLGVYLKFWRQRATSK